MWVPLNAINGVCDVEVLRALLNLEIEITAPTTTKVQVWGALESCLGASIKDEQFAVATTIKKGKILLTQLRHIGRYSHLLSFRLHLPQLVVLGHTISVVRRTSTLVRREGIVFIFIYFCWVDAGENSPDWVSYPLEVAVLDHVFWFAFFWLRIWVSRSEWILVSNARLCRFGRDFDYSGYFLRGRIGLGIWAFMSVEKIWFLG